MSYNTNTKRGSFGYNKNVNAPMTRNRGRPIVTNNYVQQLPNQNSGPQLSPNQGYSTQQHAQRQQAQQAPAQQAPQRPLTQVQTTHQPTPQRPPSQLQTPQQQLAKQQQMLVQKKQQLAEQQRQQKQKQQIVQQNKQQQAQKLQQQEQYVQKQHQLELQRQKQLEQQKQRELLEQQKKKELEQEKLRELALQRQKELELQKQKELEQQRLAELEQQKQKAIELQKQRDMELQRELEQKKQRELALKQQQDLARQQLLLQQQELAKQRQLSNQQKLSQSPGQQQKFQLQPVKQEPQPVQLQPVQQQPPQQQPMPQVQEGEELPAGGPMEIGSEETKPGRRRWTPRRKLSKYEIQRRRNYRLSKMLQPKNAMVILNEVCKGITFNVENCQTREGYAFRSTVVIDGVEHEGFGVSKAGAKSSAAERALKHLVKNKKLMQAPSIPDPSAENGTEPADNTNGTEAMDTTDSNENDAPLAWQQFASFAVYKLLASWGEDPNVMNEDPIVSMKKPAKKLPEHANLMNPLMLLNQMMPHIQFEELPKSTNGQFFTFNYKCTVDGQTFLGTATSKRIAKRQAAFELCRNIFGVEYPPEIYTPPASTLV